MGLAAGASLEGGSSGGALAVAKGMAAPHRGQNFTLVLGSVEEHLGHSITAIS
jgi:hypothetical protein